MTPRRWVGLDFGTCSTLIVDRLVGRAPASFPLGPGEAGWLPTLIGLSADNQWVIGADAEQLAETQVVRSLKSAIGEDREWLEFWDGTRRLQAVSVDDAIARILYEVRVAVLSQEPAYFDDAQVRMACPAMWSDDQRDRLARIARGVGFPVQAHEVLDEPIAAGLAYLRHRHQLGMSHPPGRLVVVDVGGGTTDVAVMEVSGPPDRPQLRTMMVHGTPAAGNAMDQAVLEHLRQQVNLIPAWMDPHESDLRRALLLQAARRLKEDLSEAPKAARPLLGTDDVLRLTADQLDEAVAPVTVDIARTVWQTINAVREDGETDLDVRDTVTHVQMAGGGSRQRTVRQALCRLFPDADVGTDPVLRYPEASVATGLAYL